MTGGAIGAFDVPIVRADEVVFEDVYRHLFTCAMRVAVKVVGDHTNAEDIAAEALARAYANWRKVSRLPYLDAWVQRVAANLAIDTVRRRRPQTDAARRVSDDLRSRAALEIEDAAVARESLARALAALPKRQRDVLTLRYLVGVNDDELAAQLSMTTSTLRTHAQRGLETLRARYGVDLEGAAR